MSKSVLYMANASTQAVAATGMTVNFGSIIRRYGCKLNQSGGNIVINGAGYYTACPTINFLAGGAGTVVATLLKDGIAVPGATTQVTVADASHYDIPIPTCEVRQTCNCQSNLAVTVSGVAGEIVGAAIVLEESV